MKNKEKVNKLARCAAVRCSKKTGKVDTTLCGMGYAMLSLWGLQNTPKSKETYVFELETGLIIHHYIGTENGFPEVEYCEDDENIEELCPGITSILSEEADEKFED